MKRFLILFVLFFAVSIQAQSLNDYQYVIVPVKFEFQKQQNQYRLNTLAKMHLERLGFRVYYDNEVLPKEMASNNCNRLFLNITENSGMFLTRLTLHLKDCMNQEIYASEEGKSREKELQPAYTEALEKAFESMSKMNYSYNGKNGAKVAATTTAGETAPVAAPASTPSAMSLTAKPIANGYDLYLKDAEGSMYLFTVYKTSSPDVYIAFQKSKQGVLLKKDGQWFFESYESGKLLSETVSISGMD